MPFLLPICIVAFAFALLLTMSIRLLAPSLGLLDVPNERSSHTTPTPRGGGASFVLLVTAAAGFLGMRIPSWQFAMYAICAACVASVSYIDDLRSVSASIRFGVQTAAAIAFMSAASAMVFHDFVPGILLSAALVFWIVSLTNMFNFMDGIDGIAGAQAVITFSAMGIYSYVASDPEMLALCFIAASATAGFLVLNWSPAKIFMGDVGSAFLGFTVGCLSVMRGNPVFVAVAAFAIWPFLFDAGLTLLKRLIRRDNILRAHRSHLYQRLTIAGHSHASVSTLYSASSILTSAAGLLASSNRIPWSAAVAVALIPTIAIPVLVRRAEHIVPVGP